MLLWGEEDWLGWLSVTRCSNVREFLLDFTLARSKKRSVVSDLCPGQPGGIKLLLLLKPGFATTNQVAG